MMNSLTTFAPRSTANLRGARVPLRILQPDLGCARTRSGDVSLTCKRQVLQSPLSKKPLARLAVFNEYGEQYDNR